MPLIDTRQTIHEIVKEVLTPLSLTESLEESALGLPRLLEALSNIVDNGQSDAVRLKAIETALKMHGSLREGVGVQTPVFHIIINGNVDGINPILLPRELISA